MSTQYSMIFIYKKQHYFTLSNEMALDVVNSINYVTVRVQRWLWLKHKIITSSVDLTHWIGSLIINIQKQAILLFSHYQMAREDGLLNFRLNYPIVTKR